MTNKTQTEQKILKEIREFDWRSRVTPDDCSRAITNWQYRLLNLSKEENPETFRCSTEKCKFCSTNRIIEAGRRRVENHFSEICDECLAWEKTDELKKIKWAKEEKPERIEKVAFDKKQFTDCDPVVMVVIATKINEIITHLNSHPNIGGK